MKWTEEQRRCIYDRTQGKCHICGKKLAFINFGQHGRRGCWSVEHSRPRVKGGTDHGNNLYAACISCNSSKGSKSTRSARAKNGRTRAPLSRKSEANVRSKNMIKGAVAGVLAGNVVAGKKGAIIGGILGGVIGQKTNPE